MLGISSHLGCEVGSHCRRDRAYSVAGDLALPRPAVCIIPVLICRVGNKGSQVFRLLRASGLREWAMGPGRTPLALPCLQGNPGV